MATSTPAREVSADMLGIPLRELGLVTEAVAVVAVEKAEVERSDEIDPGDCSRGSRRVKERHRPQCSERKEKGKGDASRRAGELQTHWLRAGTDPPAEPPPASSENAEALWMCPSVHLTGNSPAGQMDTWTT